MPHSADNIMKNYLLSVLVLISLVTSVTFAASMPVAKNVQTGALQTLDGETVSLADSKGKVVVLAIGASWLPLSKQQIITTNKLAKKYAGRDVVVYWVSTDSNNPKSKNFAPDEQIRTFVTRNKLTATTLRDSDGQYTLKRFNVDQLPSFVILDKTGKSIGEPFAGLDPENESEIFQLVSGAIDKIL